MEAKNLVQNENPAAKLEIATYTYLARSDFTEWADAVRTGVHAIATCFVIHKTVELNATIIIIMELHSKSTNI